MATYGPVDWFKDANIKDYQYLYVRDHDECKGHLPNSVFLVVSAIYKHPRFGGNQERYEMLVLFAANGKVELVERLIDAFQGKKGDFNGHCGAVGCSLLEVGLHWTATMDMDSFGGTPRAAKYPPFAYLLDDLNQRRDPQTYKV